MQWARRKVRTHLVQQIQYDKATNHVTCPLTGNKLNYKKLLKTKDSIYAKMECAMN